VESFCVEGVISLNTRQYKFLNLSQLHRIQRINRSNNKTERIMITVLRELQLPLPIRNTALQVFRSIDRYLENPEQTIYCCIYIACDLRRYPLEITRKKFSIYPDPATLYKYLVSDLRLKIPKYSAMDYIPHLAARLKLSAWSIRCAIDTLQEAIDNGLQVGGRYRSFAAAATYYASIRMGERRVRREVASAANLSMRTIPYIHRELIQCLRIASRVSHVAIIFNDINIKIVF